MFTIIALGLLLGLLLFVGARGRRDEFVAPERDYNETI